MKHDRNESEHHETVRGGREGAETSRWLSLMNMATAVGLGPTNANPSFTHHCKSFRKSTIQRSTRGD
jgi:hypothetical protein